MQIALGSNFNVYNKSRVNYLVMGILSILIGLFLFGQCEAQSINKFKSKVFQTGSKGHFGNIEDCKFFFECDCCSGKLLFPTESEYFMLNYCMADIVVTKGTYRVANDVITLKSDGTRISQEYNWKREVDPTAQIFFLKDSIINKYELEYNIDFCGKTLLVNRKSPSNLAVDSDLDFDEELAELKSTGILALIKKK